MLHQKLITEIFGTGALFHLQIANTQQWVDKALRETSLPQYYYILEKQFHLNYALIKKIELTSWTIDDCCEESAAEISIAYFLPITKIGAEIMGTNSEEETINQQLDQLEQHQGAIGWKIHKSYKIKICLPLWPPSLHSWRSYTISLTENVQPQHNYVRSYASFWTEKKKAWCNL